MSYYFIAIGGSGAKALESLTHLAAAGAFPNEEKLYLLNIDPDVGNGNLARTTKSLECYKVFQNLPIGYHSPLFRTKIETSMPFTWNPTEHNKCLDDVMSYQAYKEDAIGHLYRVLYTKKERTTLLNEGFRGHPSIGAAVMAKKINLGGETYTLEGNVWNWLKTRINEDVKTGNLSRIFLAGSIFGGTGAAGLPTVAKLLRNAFDSYCINKQVIIGGGLVLPYFSFNAPTKDEIKGEVYASAENFLTNTKAAMRYYSVKNKEEKIFDSMYFTGDSTLNQVNKFSVGASTQENDAHIVDLYVALSAVDFFSTPATQLKNCSYISHKNEDVIEWSDFPKLDENGSNIPVDMKLRFGQYIRFVFSYLLLVKPVLADLSDEKEKAYKYPWYVDYLKGVDVKNQEVVKFEQYTEDFVRWLLQLTHNTSRRQLSIIDYDIIKGINPAVLDGSLLERLISGDATGNASLHEIWFRLCEDRKITEDIRPAKDFGRFLRVLYDSCEA